MKRLLLPLLAALTLSGCNNAQTASSAHVPGELPRTGETIATVNGQPVTQSMLDAVLSTMPDEAREQLEAAGQVAQLKDQLVTQEALYQEAINQSLHTDETVKTRLALAERDALIESLLRKVVEEKTTDEGLKAWYTDHLVQFRKEQVKASHVLLETEDEANEVLEEVKKPGADFGAVATARSKDPSAKTNGGDLGWFEKGRMVKEFADAAFGAEKGAIVGPVKSQFGYHVIFVADKRDVIPFEDVKDQIKPRAQQEIAQKYVEEIKEKATGGGDEAGAAGEAPAAPAAGGDGH
jgi:peptidyl-prolyl cis-trans isomerase C